jgi:hypothetical protein
VIAHTAAFALAAAIFVLAAHDCTFTERRVKKFGIEIETSWLISWLYPWVGLDLSLAFGIMVPTLAIASFLAAHDFQIPLAMWLGAKILNTRYQYLSLALEAEIDRLRSESKPASSLAPDNSHPRDGQ